VTLLFFAALAYYAYIDESYFMSALFFLFTLLMIWVTIINAQKLSGDGPYVTITNEHLAIRILPNEKVEIRWDDITDYLFYKINGNTYIGLILADEEKYAGTMSPKMRRLSRMSQKMGYPMFNITFRHIIEKEELIEELSRRNPNVTIEM